MEEQVKRFRCKIYKVEDINSTAQKDSVYAKEMTEEYKLKQKIKFMKMQEIWI